MRAATFMTRATAAVREAKTLQNGRALMGAVASLAVASTTGRVVSPPSHLFMPSIGPVGFERETHLLNHACIGSSSPTATG